MVQPKKGSGSTDIPNGAARREGNNMSFQRKDIVGARVISDNSSKGDGKTPNGVDPGLTLRQLCRESP